MRKKIIIISLCSMLLFTCGSSKPLLKEKTEPKKEIVNKSEDALMGILISALIIYSIKILFAR